MAMSKGCTIALIIVGILLVILIVGIVLVIVNKDRIIEAGLNVMTGAIENELAENPPPGYTAESIHTLLEDFKAAIKNQSFDPDKIQELGPELQSAMGDNEITREEAVSLVRLIEDIMNRPTAIDTTMTDQTLPDTLEAVPDSL